MISELHAILKPERRTHVVDVGANPIDGDAPYKAMLQRKLCHVTGFEPQPEALKTLRTNASECERYLPYAIGDGKWHTLHVCQASGMSSLLRPDRKQLKLFNLFEEFGKVLKKVKTKTVRLDDIEEIDEIDFLKIDVQGAELMIFESGSEHLKNAVAVQAEVSFVPLYVGQPSFGEIDVFLRELGFVPHSFSGVKRWALAPTVFNDNPRSPGNQLLEADVVYVKDIARLNKVDPEKLKHLALLSHYVFRSPDLVNLVIRELVQLGLVKEGAMQDYLASVSG